MTQHATLDRHHQLCNAIHQCSMDENRFLRQHQRAPDSELTARKRALLEQLDESLAALHAEPAASARDDAARAQLDRTRARILQILQLDKENEQLLLRCSLATGRASNASPPLAPSLTMLQKIYSRCS